MADVSVSLMGVSGAGEPLLRALLAEPRVRVTAVADRSADVLTEAGRLGTYELFDDYRQLVVQSQCDLLMITAPPFAGNDYALLAAGRGAHVWRLPPLARGFEQAAALVDAFHRTDRMLLVGTAWRVDPRYQAMVSHLDELGGLFLARAAVVTHLQDPLGWRGDSTRAGGGVLLNQAYEAVDRIVALLGLPDEVMAGASRLARTQTAQSYDTEDTASVMLRYPKGVTGLIVASWLSQPQEDSFRLHGSTGSAAIDADGLAVTDADGRASVTCPHEPERAMAEQIHAVIEAVTEGRPPELPTGAQQLPTMAVIESAYLSARTGQPESPADLLGLHGISAEPPYQDHSATPEEPTAP